MKTKNSFLLILCLLLFSSLHAQNEPVKILAIGNSFADDGIEYLDEIAISAGKHIIVANTLISAGALSKDTSITPGTTNTITNTEKI